MNRLPRLAQFWSTFASQGGYSRLVAFGQSRLISYGEKMKLINKQGRKVKKTKTDLIITFKDASLFKVPAQEGTRYLTAMYITRDNVNYKLHVRLAVLDGKGNIFGEMSFPHHVASEKNRICVIAEGKAALEAKAAGATIVGVSEVLQDIKAEKIEFDQCICHIDQVFHLKSMQRILGPRGLMPTEKKGTIVSDVATAVKKATEIVPFRQQKDYIRIEIGNQKFDSQQLFENMKAFFNNLEEQMVRQSRRIAFLGCTIYSEPSKPIPVTHCFSKDTIK